MILSKQIRKRIRASGSKPIEIPWPQNGPEPKVNRKYTIQSSHQAAGEDRIIVHAVKELSDGLRATVSVDTDPIRLLGRQNGYASSARGALGTKVAPDSWDEEKAEQFRPEVEPEAVDSAFQRRLSEEARIRNVQMEDQQRMLHKRIAKEQELKDTNLSDRSRRAKVRHLRALSNPDLPSAA